MEKIEKVSLVEQAYSIIKEEILSNDFAEGKKIPSENQLCKMLNVSRVVIREALSRLRSEKIIITYHGKGSYRANPNNFMDYGKDKDGLDFEKFKQIMDFRAGIENTAIKLAVQCADDNQLHIIKTYAEKMVNPDEDFDQIDYTFHYLIVKASGNFLLQNAFESCEDLIKSSLKTMNSIKDAKEYAVNFHVQIADALIKRDSDKAISLMENNGEYNFARMQAILNSK